MFKILISFFISLFLASQFAFAGEKSAFHLSAEQIQSLNYRGVAPLVKAAAYYVEHPERPQERLRVDSINGVFSPEAVHKVIEVLRMLEPEIRLAHQQNPESKFRMLVATSGDSNRYLHIATQEILDFLKDVNQNTIKDKAKVNKFTIERLRQVFGGIFDQTVRADVYWGLARFVGSGSSSSIGFYLADYPIPTSLLVGYGLVGMGSGTVGVLIEKFTGWLDNNEIDPKKRVRNRLGSIETALIMSPLLLGLKSTGLATPEGLALIAGTASASVLIQNVYYELKKRSPQAAMWYKWASIEIPFILTPIVTFTLLGYPTKGSVAVLITSVYASSALATAAQGSVDILITKVRRGYLQAAQALDFKNIVDRISTKNVFDLKPEHFYAARKIEENKVRAPYKKYFFIASVVSVASAISSTTGVHIQNPSFVYFGTAGLLGLGAVGVSGLIYKFYIDLKERLRLEALARPEVERQYKERLEIRERIKNKENVANNTESTTKVGKCGRLF